MRRSLSLGFIVLNLMVPAVLQAQPKKDPEKPAPATTSRAILANLQTELAATPFRESLKFSDFLTLTQETLQARGKDVSVLVDEEAFKEERPDTDIFETEIRLRNLPAKVSVHHLLRQALKQLPTKSAFVIRAGKVEIVPYARTGKEFMLNQTFHAEFKDRRLEEALDELSELTGVSIIVDGRAKQKAQATVSARFHDDVAVQDAVRMLTNMADLKVVYLVTGIMVTTPEHAPALQKELNKAYGIVEETPASPTAPAAPAATTPTVPALPMMFPFGPGMAPPDPSPLAPPLPPTRKRLEPAA